MAPEPLKTLPQPPEQLDGDEYAKKIWAETTYHLEALQVLTGVDLPMLAHYCKEVSRYWKAQAQLEREGEVTATPSGYPMLNPWVSVSNQALDRALKIAGQYGFTPAARTRIGTLGKPPEEDPFEAYLKAG